MDGDPQFPWKSAHQIGFVLPKWLGWRDRIRALPTIWVRFAKTVLGRWG